MTDRCGHNFCHDCLTSNVREENEWPCPECRTIQTKTVDGLTQSRFVERAVEKFKAQKSETKAACITHGMPYSLCKLKLSLIMSSFKKFIFSLCKTSEKSMPKVQLSKNLWR